MAPGSSLGAHGSSWWLLAYENHSFIKQNLYFSFPRAFLNVSQDLYPGSFQMHEDYRFVDFWIQGELLEPRLESHGTIIKNNLVSDHCSLGHLFVGPSPTTHRASGVPTKNMCLRKSVSIIICPPPLSHHALYCYLQSRYSTKCNVLTQ